MWRVVLKLTIMYEQKELSDGKNEDPVNQYRKHPSVASQRVGFLHDWNLLEYIIPDPLSMLFSTS